MLTTVSDFDFSAVLIACVVGLYWNSCGAGYVWDDRAAIVGNQDVHGQSSVMDLFQNDFWGQDMKLVDSHKSYRPVTVLTYRINHYFGGLHPEGFHIGNVVIYALAVMAMYTFCGQWMGRRAARVATLLFCFHPTHVEAVASLVGRADCLCGFLFLSSCICYSHHVRADAAVVGYAGKSVTLLAAVVLAVAASLAKEVGITVFGVLVALEFAETARDYQLALVGRRQRAGKAVQLTVDDAAACLRCGVENTVSSRRRLLRLAVLVVSLAVFLRVRMMIHGEHTMFKWTPLENHIVHKPDFLGRILSYGQSHFWYAAKLLYPRYLCFDYGLGCIPTISHVLDFRNLLPIAVYSGAGYAIYSALRDMRLAYLVGWAALLAPLFPALNVLFPVGTLLAERLLFVPSIGFCMLVGEFCAVDLRYSGPWIAVKDAMDVLIFGSEGSYGNGNGNSKAPDVAAAATTAAAAVAALSKDTHETAARKKRRDGELDRAFMLYLLLPLLALCGARVYTRNADWCDEKRIFFSALDVCPLSTKAMTNAGMFKLRSGGSDTGNYTGENAEPIELLARALSVYNKQSAANINLGIAYLNDGHFYEAAASYTRSIHIAGASPKVLGYLGNALSIWAERGGDGVDHDTEQWLRRTASRVLDDALAANSGGHAAPGIILKRALLAKEMGRLVDAAHMIREAISTTEEALAQPHLPSQDLVGLAYTYGVLATIYEDLDQIPEAEAAYQAALEAHGDIDCSVKNNFAMFYRQHGRLEEAYALIFSCGEPSATEAVAVYNNMGMLHSDAGRWVDAIASFNKGLEALAGDSSAPMYALIQTNIRNAEGKKAMESRSNNQDKS